MSEDRLKKSLDDYHSHSNKSMEHLRHELAKVRTGRANADLFEEIRIDYYGTPTPLKGMASVTVPEPRMVMIQPWDISQLETIEKALRNQDLGYSPSNDGRIIRVPIPALTEDRRKTLVKQVRKLCEEARVAMRTQRNKTNEQIKKAEKDKDASEDEMRRALDQVNKIIEDMGKKVDEVLKAKEEEVMEI